jgi:hypothetical protein
MCCAEGDILAAGDSRGEDGEGGPELRQRGPGE